MPKNSSDISSVSVPGFISQGLVNMGLSREGEALAAHPLTGGVSSDIWKVTVGEDIGRTYCIKRALAQLKVAENWEAPVERVKAEIDWLKTAHSITPGNILKVVGEDDAEGCFAMEYLSQTAYESWKQALAAGKVDIGVARSVARAIVAVHRSTAGDSDVAEVFANDSQFMALRPDPYFITAGRKNPDVADIINRLTADLMATKKVLVHGDLSPKNILIGPKGPYIVDAETAWYGDPAFDLAFCLNHLLLKCVWHPGVASLYLTAYSAFTETYMIGVDWEPHDELERRAITLLYAMLLARVDGKSPAEYITTAHQKSVVRDFAKAGLKSPAGSLGNIARQWRTELQTTF
ncbi:phosphotransferase family protein [Kordiimonas sp.]|uniref:phosphotransferase family protein n=1 Tax=Kordiimonas sp. TaxID=1970157 RepID=UPI003A8F0938